MHLLRLHLGAQPQVCELDVAVPVKQDVVRLEIAVNVPQLVHLNQDKNVRRTAGQNAVTPRPEDNAIKYTAVSGRHPR